MSSFKSTITDEPKYRESTGVKDGGKTLLRCSNCDAPLVEIWITRPTDELDWDIVAECPHCGDRSFKKSFHGSFVIGNWVEGESETGGGKMYTAYDYPEADGNVLIIKTKKVNKWKPRR